MTTHLRLHRSAEVPEERPGARIAIALALTSVLVIAEAAAGMWARSLALLSDAGHNLTDVLALGLSWYAVRLSAKPANAGKTFGYHRAGILVALINSTTLVIVSFGIFYQAYLRFQSPPDVKSGVLIGVGVAAFFVNLGTAWLLKRGSESDLNLRSAFVHLMGDVFSTVGAVLAGIAISFTGLNWLDPLASVFIGLLILWNAGGILRETVDILLESTPRNVDVDKMRRDLRRIKGVRGVHDLHAWSITQNLRALSAHVVTDDVSISKGAKILNEINELAKHQYGIAHTTLQLEYVKCKSCTFHRHTEKIHPSKRKEPS